MENAEVVEYYICKIKNEGNGFGLIRGIVYEYLQKATRL